MFGIGFTVIATPRHIKQHLSMIEGDRELVGSNLDVLFISDIDSDMRLLLAGELLLVMMLLSWLCHKPYKICWVDIIQQIRANQLIV